MGKLLFLFLALVSTPLFATSTSSDEAEALFVRRILEFWKDKEYAFVKDQIETFQERYPESSFLDQFSAMLGDVAMHQKAYGEALDHYEKISSYSLRASVRSKKWLALYQLKNYPALYQQIAPIRDKVDEEGVFYFAEAAFREGLKLHQQNPSDKQAEILFREALPTYRGIQNHATFGSHVKLAMAEIHRLLDEPEEAAELYLEIAEEGLEEEEILFHAACMLAQFDTAKAMEIFERLSREGEKRGEDAAFQWLQLLAKEERWKEIAYERRLLLSRLSQEHLPVAYFYLGMLAHEQGQHPQAILDLTKSIEGKVQEKQALLTLMRSACELGKTDVSEKFYSMGHKNFPDQTQELKLLRAATYQRAGETRKALDLYDALIDDSEDLVVAEQATLEKVRLLMEEKEWGIARETLIAAIKRFAHSERTSEMMRLAIDLSLSQVTTEDGYLALAEDLERAIGAKLFDGEELDQKKGLLAKTYLKLHRVPEALDTLRSCSETDHLLMAQCYLHEGSSPDQVVYHGERAIEEDPSRESLHIHLFNAYRDLSKSHHNEEMTAKGAAHLDRVIDHYPISIENRLWLAHYYAKERHPRAITLFESLLQTEANMHRFDREALLLASMHHENGEDQTACQLLERLIALKTPHQPQGELLYAQISQNLGDVTRAHELYQRLEQSPDAGVSYGARLALARLQFHDQPERSLRTLEELKVRKTLANEPIHLEAALDHADLTSTLVPEKKRLERLHELLLGIKQEFTDQSDLWSKDYHAARALMPEKEALYQAYMRYLDARLYAVEAQLTKDRHVRKAKDQAAQTLFSSLSQGKYALTPYLVEKATEEIHEQ